MPDKTKDKGKPKSNMLPEVKITTKKLPTYNSQDSLSFGYGTNKTKYAVKDIKSAVKAKTLSGVDTTSNKTISQSGGKYNRNSEELKLGVALAKKKKK